MIEKIFVEDNPFLGKCRSKGVFIDTELLLLYCVGSSDIRIIKEKRFKKTDKFDENAFEIVNAIVQNSKKIYVTPHILAELSNHAQMLKGDRFMKFLSIMEKFVRAQCEVFIRKEDLLDNPKFSLLGFADVSIFRACSGKGCAALTSDWLLYQYLWNNKIPAVNFTNLWVSHWKES